MNLELSRKIDRLITLYYYVGQPRKWIGKLDAATEITVAICDLFPPPLDAEQFWLSDVQLLRDGKEIEAASSLAPFDRENGIREELCKVAPSKVVDLGGGMVLMVPQTVPEDACEELRHFWKEILPTFESDIFQDLASHSHRTTDSQTTESRDYLLSLRHIFDSIVGGDEDAYTLQVSRTGETFKVSKRQSVDFALGYWLPGSTLFKLVGENVLTSSEVVDLETILKPAGKREVLISQSHSNVHSRKASLVRNQLNRSEYLKRRYPLSKDETMRRVGELEKKVWGDPPHTIVMMPLVSYGCCDSDQYAVTTAHCYVAVKGEPDVEKLMLRRYRALRTFEDGMYRRYCQTMASALAHQIIGGESAKDLTMVASTIAAMYYIPSKVSLKDAANSGSRNLYEQLRLFRKVIRKETEGRDSKPWATEIDLTLRSLALEWDKQTRPTEEADVIGLLNQSLELEASRAEGKFRNLRESFHAQFNKLTYVLDRAQEIKDLLVADFEYPRAPWQRVRQMRVFHENSRSFICESEESVNIEGIDAAWNFLKGHDFHLSTDVNGCGSTSGLCDIEATRRVAYMFKANAPSGKMSGRNLSDYSWPSLDLRKKSASEFVEFCERSGLSPGEWIKRSSEEGSEKSTPSLAAIITLLFLSGARVKPGTELAKHLTSKLVLTELRSWDLSLYAIACLSRQGNDRSEVELRLSGKEVVFVLGEGIEKVLAYREWFENRRGEAQRAHLGRGSHSRIKDIAAAYMYDEGELPRHLKDGSIGNIALRLEGDHLHCIWRTIGWK